MTISHKIQGGILKITNQQFKPKVLEEKKLVAPHNCEARTVEALQ